MQSLLRKQRVVQTTNGFGRDRHSALTGYALVLGSLLLLLVWQLHVEWTINPQYNFAWAVPGLALYLFWKRWPTRPTPKPTAVPLVLSLAAGLLFAALLPLRVVHEANPDWRLTSWLLALVSVALGVLGLWFTGGRPWLKHFLVPVTFILVAVPWPVRLEQTVMQSLMRGVVSVTSDLMNLLGYAVIQRGNFIELTQGTVEINEGCSGIRSLQTTLMVALVVGELYFLPIGRRLGLLLGGFVWSILLNLFRAFLITWMCARMGTDAALAWHDPAGYLMLGVTIAGVWAAGFVLAAGEKKCGPAPQDTIEAAIPTPDSWPRALTPKLTWAMVGWLLLTEVATEVWYRGQEVAARERSSWSVAFPSVESGFHARELPPDLRAILRCDESQSGIWQRPDGSEWTLFFLKWHPGRMAARLARGHTPDVCLPANGFKFLAVLDPMNVQVGQVELPFNTYAFENRGQLYFVFFCLTDSGGALMPEQAASAAQTYLDELRRPQRLRAVWNGIRHRGQQVLEIAMTGYATPAQAREALCQALPNLVLFKSS